MTFAVQFLAANIGEMPVHAARTCAGDDLSIDLMKFLNLKERIKFLRRSPAELSCSRHTAASKLEYVCAARLCTPL